MNGAEHAGIKSILAGKGYWGNILGRYLEGSGFDCSFVYGRSSGVSFEDALNSLKPEAVFVCTPVSTHFDIVKSALLSGSNVFCEKMLTNDEKKAEELFRIADGEGKILFTDYIYLYSPSVRKMKELVSSLGSLKEIRGIITQYGKFYDDVDVIGNIGVHMISAAGYITDFSPVRNIVLDNRETKDGMMAECSLSYRSGESEVDILASIVSEEKVRRIRVSGEHGSIEYDMNSVPPLTFKTSGITEYDFDEANTIRASLNVFSKCVNDPSDSEYLLNRKCCMFTEQVASGIRM